jgi:hypothetical protein
MPTGDVRLYPDTVELPLDRRDRRRLRSLTAAIAIPVAIVITAPVTATRVTLVIATPSIAVTAVPIAVGCVGDDLAQRRLDGRRAGGEHWLQWLADLQPELRERIGPAAQRRPGHRGQ